MARESFRAVLLFVKDQVDDDVEHDDEEGGEDAEEQPHVH